MSTQPPSSPSAPQTLQYGMKIQLFAKCAQGADPRQNYCVTNYEKRGLVVLDDSDPITWTIVPTSSTQNEVCYGDKILLVDEKGLVMNGHDTGTWGKGYISLKDRSVQGELNFHFSRPSQPLIKGSPILLQDTANGNKVNLHAFFSKGFAGQPQDQSAAKTTATKQPITAERKSNSGCKGGYIRFNGTGTGPVLGFDLKVVDLNNNSSAPTAGSASQSQLRPQNTPSVLRPLPPDVTVHKSALSSPSVQSGSRSDPGQTTSTTSGGGELDKIEENADSDSSNNHRYHAAGERTVDPNNKAAQRPYNPDPYDIAQEVIPLRYGDKVRLIAKSPYLPEGGPVGLYRKHELVGCGPIISSKTGKLLEEEDFEEFVPSEFIICGTGPAKTGDIVRYSSHLVLVDANNGNSIWNCRETETWGSGYIAEGPLVQNGVNPIPATLGPPLVSSNFSHITQNSKLPSGQIHISFQPASSPLLGFPIHNMDANVFIDVEETHQKKGKMNCRLSVYKKKSSMLTGGYLICLPNAGKPVSFTIERVQHVPIQRKSVYLETLTTKPSGYVQETTQHYRRDKAYVSQQRSRERMKLLITVATLWLGTIAFGYFIRRYQYQNSLGPNASRPLIHQNGTNSLTLTIDQEAVVTFLGHTLLADQYLFYNQVFYMVLTLLFAIYSVFLSTSAEVSPYHDAQSQQSGLVQVEVERNSLVNLIIDAQNIGKGNNPLQWMIDAGLDPDHIVVPQRYIDAEKGDADKGRKRYLVTAKWQYINGFTTILDRPHPMFRIIKKFTVQFFYGRDLKGNCVYYETPKAAKLPEFDALGVSIDELLFHFVYITEYLYQRLDTRESARCVSVVDINGIAFADFGGKVVDFVQQVSKITSQHYPERSAGILCINAGWAFQLIWKIVASMMDPVTRAKTHLWGGDFVDKMAKIIPSDQIPQMFGGAGRFTPSIPDKGPVLPKGSIEEKFNAIEIAPLSKEEEDMFKIADAANVKYAEEHPNELIPRPLLKEKLEDMKKQ